MYFAYVNFCTGISESLNLIGNILNLYKLFLPLILIVIGMFDIFKSVISSKTGDIKKNLMNLLKRVVIVVCIYFVPIAIITLFDYLSDFKSITEDSKIDFNVCYDCLFKTSSDTCKKAISESKNEE